MGAVNDLSIRQSLNQYLTTTALADDFHTGDPTTFDPQDADTSQWVFVQVTAVKRVMHSKPGAEQFDVVVEVDAFNRSETEMLGGAAMVAKVRGILERAKIPIYDYATSGDPQVGWLRLNEADSKEYRGKVWQSHRISIRGVAESLV